MAKETFHSCPNQCHIASPGAPVYKCKNCGKMYCRACMPKSKCEKCGTDWLDAIGLFFRYFTIGYIK
jgi:hypothetical protein